MALLVRLLWFGAALAGWRLARRVPRYRVVPLVLGTGWALDLLRTGPLKLALANEPRPFVGFARAAYHLDQGAVLAFPALSVGLVLAVCLRLPRRWTWALAGAAWVGWLGAAAAVYPALRETLWMDYVGRIGLVSVAVQLFAAGVAVARARLAGDVLGVPERACLVLLAGDAGAALFGPWLGAPVEHWPIWRLQSAITLGTLTALEIKWTLARTPDGGFLA